MQESNKLLIPGAILVAGILVAGAVYYGGKVPTPTSNKPVGEEIELKPITDEDHILGSREAKVVVVEYSDTECPFCKVFHNTMKEVAAQYDGKVAWVYRHFPIPQLHQKAMKEAEATECVASLAGNATFWRYLDRIFETTSSNDSLDPTTLPKLAVEVGVSEIEFSACLSSGRFTGKVSQQMEDAVAAGARGTPYSLILDEDGKVKDIINGAEPLATVRAKIDAILK